MRKIGFGMVLMAFSVSAFSEQHVVIQKDKSFSPSQMKIKVNDVVEFANEDPFNHNVFSLSDTQMFDLGSYPKGESSSVKFDQPGVVDVECAIHPDMRMTIEVAE